MSADTAQITVGLDIGYESIRLVAIERSPQGPTLRRVGIQPLAHRYTPNDLFTNTEDVTAAVRTVIETHSDPAWPVVVGLRNRFATLMLPHVDKSMNPKTTYEWLMWEAEHVIDTPLDDHVVDIGPTGHETDTGKDVCVVIARQESVDALMELMQAAGVTPVGMTVATVALINAFEVTHTLTEWESAALVHIEPGALDIVFIRGSSLNMAVMPLESGQGDGNNALHMFGDQFRYLLNVMPEEDAPDTVYVSMEDGGILSGLCSQWGEQLNRRVTPLMPFQGLQIDPSVEEQVQDMEQAAFMVATGLALHKVD